MRSTAEDAVPVTRLDLTGISPEEQFEVWHQSTSPVFDSASVNDLPHLFAGSTCYLVDSLLFTRAHFDRMRFSRRRHHLRNGESDFISLQYYCTGSITGCLDDGTPLYMAPDRISIHDFARAYSGIGATTESFGVIIPRRELARHERLFRARPMFSWAIDSPKGHLLTSALASIWRELPRATRAEGSALASGLIGLLNGLLAAEPSPIDSEHLGRAALVAVQDYIRANLHRGDLDVGELCEAVNPKTGWVGTSSTWSQGQGAQSTSWVDANTIAEGGAGGGAGKIDLKTQNQLPPPEGVV